MFKFLIDGCNGSKENTRKELIFPLLFRNNSSVFSYKDCCFAMQKDREGSARISLYKEVGIINCFTLEISFCGADFGKYEYFHFNQDIYEQIAHDFIMSLYDFFDPEGSKIRNVVEEIDQMMLKSNGEKKDKETDDSDYSNEENKQDLEEMDKIPM